MKRELKTGRTSTNPRSNFFPRNSARCLSAALFPALLLAPAFFSCTQDVTDAQAPRRINIVWQQPTPPESIHLFYFDTLGVQALDTYQQLNALVGQNHAISGTGVKRLVALSGISGNSVEWQEEATYGNLCKHVFSLEREDAAQPLLAGQALLEDGASRALTLPLKTMLSAIKIRSVACDFSGRTYEAEDYDNFSLFLSYAASEYLPLDPQGGRAVSWMNLGDVDSVSVGKLKCPEMVLQQGYGRIRKQRRLEEKTFYCYANTQRPEDMPLTRLVMAGRVAGKSCYYAIELPPLLPGVCYQLDITLKRMGTDSPDIPARSGSLEIQTQTMPWEERAHYTVTY